MNFVSRDEVEGNIEIRGKQNSLFPSGLVIKCLELYRIICGSPPCRNGIFLRVFVYSAMYYSVFLNKHTNDDFFDDFPKISVNFS